MVQRKGYYSSFILESTVCMPCKIHYAYNFNNNFKKLTQCTCHTHDENKVILSKVNFQ